MRKSEAIATLQRRADYLREEVANDAANGYDIAEIAALDVAIQSLTETEQRLMTSKGRRKRATLERMAVWRKSTPDDDPAKPYQMQEAAALEFAVEVIKEHFLHVRPIK